MPNTRTIAAPGPWNITDPDWPTYSAPALNPILVSDTFASGSGEIVGRVADAGLGGTARTWEGTTGLYTIASGTAGEGATAAGQVGFPLDVADMEVSAKIVALPSTAGAISIYARFQAADRLYRVNVFGSGGMTVQKRAGGSLTTVPGDWGAAPAVGGTIALRVVGDQISVLVDGVLRETVTDGSVAGPGGARVGQSATIGTGRWDDFKARQITDAGRL